MRKVWVMRLTIALALLAAACGAPVDPQPTADGGTSDRPARADGCRPGEVRLAGTCIPAEDDNCGAFGRACDPGWGCAITASAAGLTVSCVRD